MIKPTATRKIDDRSGVIMPLGLDRLAAQATAMTGRRPVILIDGRSGAGKTTLAHQLSARLGGRDGLTSQLVSLDDCYPGWNGLAAASAAVPQTMLPAPDGVDGAPSRPAASGYRRYDWSTGRLTDWVPLDDRQPLIIEGCGAITPASAARATLRLWVCDAESQRRAAATSRDGDVTAWWRAWSAQEQRHIEADHPDALADVIINPRQSVMWLHSERLALEHEHEHRWSIADPADAARDRADHGGRSGGDQA